jgi:OmpA-OmpF porin, OOP family
MNQHGSTRTPILVFIGITLVSAALFFVYTLPAMRKAAAAAEAGQPAATPASQAARAGDPASPAAGAPAPAPAAPAAGAADPANPAGSASPPAAPPTAPAAPDPAAPAAPRAVANPAEIIEQVAQTLLANNPAALRQALGDGLVGSAELAALESLLAADGFEIDPAAAVAELGRTPTLQRWAVNLRKRGQPDVKSRIEIDFARQADGSWLPAKLHLPGAANNNGAPLADAEALAHAIAFLDAVKVQDIAAARAQVDGSRISDATLAGLCILFEEGGFLPRAEKPLTATVARDNVAWFLANVTSAELQTESHFGLVLHRDPGTPWRITEVNLDRILSVYASRFGEGDIYFTPLVRNPQGGDSIVLYFTYNSDELHPRTLRQIEIIASVLKADPERKLKIWGHTDAIGTPEFNNRLSQNRAAAVRAAFVRSGAAADQIEVHGFGASRPRRANFLPTGEDNPEGRRVNRRAEIYLDF